MRILVATLFASGLFISPALAAPVPATKTIQSSIQSATESQVVQVQERRYRRDRNYRNRDRNYRSRDRSYRSRGLRSHRNYRPGYRYRHAPRGWHRYHSRPYGWRNRGCIIVGPVWFCP